MNINVDDQYYRLRIGELIVGFCHISKAGRTKYTKDLLWWNSEEIVHDEKDLSCNILDINRQLIFEHDLVTFRKTKKDQFTKKGIVYTEDNYWFVHLLEEDGQLNLVPAESTPFRDDIRILSSYFDEVG